MRGWTKGLALALVLALAVPGLYYFAFLQASGAAPVQPLRLWNATAELPVTAVAISPDNSTLVVGMGDETCGAVAIYKKYSATPGVPERRFPPAGCAWGRVRDVAIDSVLGCGQHVVAATEAKGSQPGQVILMERSVAGNACGAFLVGFHAYTLLPGTVEGLGLGGDPPPNATSVDIDRAGLEFVAGTGGGSVLFFETTSMKSNQRPVARYNGPHAAVDFQFRRDPVAADLLLPDFQGVSAVRVASDPNGRYDRAVVGTAWGEVWLFQRGATAVGGGPRVVSVYPRAENTPQPPTGQLTGTSLAACLQGAASCVPVTALDYSAAGSARFVAVGFAAAPSQAPQALMLEENGGVLAVNGLHPAMRPAGTRITAAALSESTVFRQQGFAGMLVATDDGNVEFMRSDSRTTAQGGRSFAWIGEDFGRAVADAGTTPDARHLAVGDVDGILRMYEAFLSDAEIAGTMSPSPRPPVWEAQVGEPVVALALADDGTLVAGSAPRGVHVFAAPPTSAFRVCFGATEFTLDCTSPSTPVLRKGQWVGLKDLTAAPDVPLKRVLWSVEHLQGGQWTSFASGSGAMLTFELTRTGQFRFFQTAEDETGNSVVVGGRVVVTTPGGAPDGVRDRNGGSFSTTGTAPTGVLSATPLAVAIGQNVTFNASASTDADGTIVQYAFTFGDGANAAQATPVVQHAYTRAGNFVARVTVRDDDGLTGASNTVTIAVGGTGGGGGGPVPPSHEVFVPFLPVRQVDLTTSGSHAAACGGLGTSGGFVWYTVGGDRTLALLRSETGGSTPGIAFCRISESGLVAAYGSDTGRVTVQWAGNGTRVHHQSPGPSNPVRGLDLSDDGRWIFVCYRDGKVRVYNTDVSDGPREEFAMSRACRALAGVANGESFMVTAGDAKVHLFRRNRVASGPSDSMNLGATGVSLDVMRTLGPEARYYALVGERTGGVQFLAAIGDDLFSGGRYVHPSAQTANVTISESTGTWAGYAGFGNGDVSQFASNGPTGPTGHPLPVATYTASDSPVRRVNALAVSAPLLAPQGPLNARHMVFGVEGGVGYTFDTIHDDPRTRFHTKDRTGVRSVDITAAGLILAGDARCTVGPNTGSCLYLFPEPPTSDFRSGTWNGTAVEGATHLPQGQPSSFDGGLTVRGFRDILAYSWNFGDGSGEFSGRIVNHTYASASAYTVTLTVTDNGTVTDRIKKKVTVMGGAPVARLTVTPASQLTLTDFTFDARASTDPGGALVEYCYSFGDGARLCTGSALVKHMYLDGTVNYTARVTVRDNSGLKNTSLPVTVTAVNRNPDATFTVHQANHQNHSLHVDANRPVTFNATGSRDRDGSILLYHWDFGDGGNATTTQVTVSHTYLTVGVFNVTLRAEDDDGALSAPFTRQLRADDSLHVANVTLAHDFDGDGNNKYEKPRQPLNGSVLLHDAFGVPVAGATCGVRYYYDGPLGVFDQTPDDGQEFGPPGVLTTAADGKGTFVVPYNNPDGVYTTGVYHLLVSCRKEGTFAGDTEWEIDVRRNWKVAPHPN